MSVTEVSQHQTSSNNRRESVYSKCQDSITILDCIIIRNIPCPSPGIIRPCHTDARLGCKTWVPLSRGLHTPGGHQIWCVQCVWHSMCHFQTETLRSIISSMVGFFFPSDGAHSFSSCLRMAMSLTRVLVPCSGWRAWKINICCGQSLKSWGLLVTTL